MNLEKQTHNPPQKKVDRLLVGHFHVGHQRTYEELIGKLAHAYDIDFFTFSEEDINLSNRTINGRFWDCSKQVFIEKIVRFPDIIDHFPNKGIEDPRFVALRNECICTPLDYFKNKIKTDAMIIRAGLGDYMIETLMFQDIENIDTVLGKYKSVILKPPRGGGGRGIYTLRKKENNYYMNTGFETIQLQSYEFDQYRNEFYEKGYLVQPLLNFKTQDGVPYDVRMHIHRGEDGKWKFIGMLIRVGSKYGVRSNLTQGGFYVSSSKLHQTKGMMHFFKEYVSAEDAESIIARLVHFAEIAPQQIQKECKHEINQIAFDLGIDRNDKCKLYIIEMSGFCAIPSAVAAELSYAKFAYWKHVAKDFERYMKIQQRHYKRKYPAEKDDIKKLEDTVSAQKVEITSLVTKNKELLNELKSHKNLLNTMKNSHSWKVTTPLRFIKNISKK